MLQFKHFLLELYTAAGSESPDLAITSEHSMAGNNQRQTIMGHYLPNGPRGAGPSYLHSQFAISCCVAKLYIPARGKNLTGKSAQTFQLYWYIKAEIDISTFEISDYLLLNRVEKLFTVLCVRVIPNQLFFKIFPVSHRQIRSQKGTFGAGEPKPAPFRFENRVIDWFFHYL